MIPAFKKYFFALLVSAYVLTAAGVPVYLHYCGGELEEINYLVEGGSCCPGEEEGEADDCCKNEGLLLVNNSDFIKNNELLSIAGDQLDHCYVTLPYSFRISTFTSATNSGSAGKESVPLLRLQLISTVILRI